MNRKRLKGDGGKDDCRDALVTLYNVLMTMTQMMAPFTPFITEMMYQNLKKISINQDPDQPNESVHYLMLPEVKEQLIHEDVERQVAYMQNVIEVGRILRDRRTLPIKYPLPDVVVISKNEIALADVKQLERYILEELNVKALTVTTEKEKYGVQLKAEPDIKALGLRLRNESKPVVQAIRQLTDADLQRYQRDPDAFEVAGVKLEKGELKIKYTFGESLSGDLKDKYEADSEGEILVLLNVEPDDSMKDEGTAREVINRIQKLRKKAQLVPSDEITVYYSCDKSDGELERIIQQFKEFITNTLKAQLKQLPLPNGMNVIVQDKQELKGESIEVVIVKH